MRTAVFLTAMAALVLLLTARTSVHKPITSPFTYSKDVLPILRERCGRCHASGGVAPMSLLTHADAVPWAESMRLELTAGRMPPWSVDRGTARIHNPGNLSGRELNVLLTWASGGTPPGDVVSDPLPIVPSWSLGAPDAVLTLPRITLAATEQEHVAEFVLPGFKEERLARAVDLLPGTPAMVRSATIELRGADGTSIHTERVLALWVPGDPPSSVTAGAVRIPAGSELLVRVRYRKTWQYEGKEMSDQSRVGLYFTAGASSALQAVSVSSSSPATLPRAMRVVAVYPDNSLADAGVSIIATRPDGHSQELMAFHPRRGWVRRYWFREPLLLARGTRLHLRVAAEPPQLLSTSANPAPHSSTPQVTVNLLQ